MNPNLQNLPQNKLVTAIKQASQTALELKSRQRMSGASNQLSYRVETNNTWDIVQALPTGTSVNDPLLFTVTFNADGSQENPVAVPIFDIRVNGTGESNKLTFINNEFGFGAPGYQTANGKVFFYASAPDLTHLTNPYLRRWGVPGSRQMTTSEAWTLYIKATVIASCPGTLSVVWGAA